MDTSQINNVSRVIIDSVEYIKRTDVLEFYSDIANKQATQFTILISVLCGITVLFLAASWWWNYNASKKQISTEIDDAKIALQKLMNIHKNTITTELNSYKDNLDEFKRGLQESVNRQIEHKVNDQITLFDKQVKEQFEKIQMQFNNDMSASKAEIARIFAVHCDSTKNYENAINWWFISMEYYSTLDNARMLRITINAAKSDLEKIDIDSLTEETSLVYNDNIKIANNNIPDILSDEKKTILKKLNQIKTKIESLSLRNTETGLIDS